LVFTPKHAFAQHISQYGAILPITVVKNS